MRTSTQRMKRRLPEAGRFNAGQKDVVLGAVGRPLVLFASGLVLWWPELMPRALRLAAVLVHPLAAIASIGGIIVHIYMGTAAVPGALRGMIQGWVSPGWAASHHLNGIGKSKGAKGALVGRRHPHAAEALLFYARLAEFDGDACAARVADGARSSPDAEEAARGSRTGAQLANGSSGAEPALALSIGRWPACIVRKAMAHPSPWSRCLPYGIPVPARDLPRLRGAGRIVYYRRNRCRTYRRSVCEFCRRYLHVIRWGWMRGRFLTSMR